MLPTCILVWALAGEDIKYVIGNRHYSSLYDQLDTKYKVMPWRYQIVFSLEIQLDLLHSWPVKSGSGWAFYCS